MLRILHFPTSSLRLPSLRILHNELSRLHHAISTSFPSLFDNTGPLQDLPHFSTIASRPESPGQIFLDDNTNGLTATSKSIYGKFNYHVNELSSFSSTHWHELGFLPPSHNIPWKAIYQLPTSKKEGDVQFKLFHNILPSLTVLHHLNSVIPSSCGWCGERGTIHHLFIICPSIQPALNLLHKLLSHLLPDIKLNFDFYWVLIPHARGRDREPGKFPNNKS